MSGARVPSAALVVVAAGIAAALHVGKLPPAVPALQAQLQVSLLEAGFLLSLVQVAGMLLGLVAGLAADSIGLRRSMLAGLLLLSAASAAGSLAGAVASPVAWLLAWRAVEGLGFLLAVMPGPGLVRRLAPAGADKAAMGLWGAYMPVGVALALLLGPTVIAHGGWALWWQGLAALSAAAAIGLWRAVAPDPRAPAAGVARAEPWPQRLVLTLRTPRGWGAAGAFGLYSAQWMAVIGFLPTICVAAGIGAGATAGLTALAAALNMVGNVVGGRLLQRGWAPVLLLRLGFAVMGIAALAAFAGWGGAPAGALSLLPRYLAVCLFSLCGGMVPATLFMLAVRVAPTASTVSTTVGLLQQVSSLGQFVAPPVVAWVAHRTGGWQWTWVCTLACSLAGIAVGTALASTRKAPA